MSYLNMFSKFRPQNQQNQQIRPSQQSSGIIIDPNNKNTNSRKYNTSFLGELKITARYQQNKTNNNNINTNTNNNVANIIRMAQKNKYFQCQVCGQNKRNNDLLSYCSCEGKFCRKCVIKQIEKKLNEMQDPTCCCGKLINVQSGFLFDIAPQMYERYLAMRFTKQIKENNFKMCRNGCENGILAETNINRKNLLKCIMCSTIYCPKCLQKNHNGNCDNRILLEMVTKQNYCFCTKCKRAVFKDGGCNFMRCTCNYCFCDVCWGPYPDHSEPHICVPQNQREKTKIITQLQKDQLQQQSPIQRQQRMVPVRRQQRMVPVRRQQRMVPVRRQQEKTVQREVQQVYCIHFYNQLSKYIVGSQNKNSSLLCQIIFFFILILFFWIFIVLYSIVICIIYYGVIKIGCKTARLYCQQFKKGVENFNQSQSKFSKVLYFLFLVILILYFLFIFIVFYLMVIYQQYKNGQNQYIYYKREK